MRRYSVECSIPTSPFHSDVRFRHSHPLPNLQSWEQTKEGCHSLERGRTYSSLHRMQHRSVTGKVDTQRSKRHTLSRKIAQKPDILLPSLRNLARLSTIRCLGSSGDGGGRGSKAGASVCSQASSTGGKAQPAASLFPPQDFCARSNPPSPFSRKLHFDRHFDLPLNLRPRHCRCHSLARSRRQAASLLAVATPVEDVSLHRRPGTHETVMV